MFTLVGRKQNPRSRFTSEEDASIVRQATRRRFPPTLLLPCRHFRRPATKISTAEGERPASENTLMPCSLHGCFRQRPISKGKRHRLRGRSYANDQAVIRRAEAEREELTGRDRAIYIYSQSKLHVCAQIFLYVN